MMIRLWDALKRKWVRLFCKYKRNYLYAGIEKNEPPVSASSESSMSKIPGSASKESYDALSEGVSNLPTPNKAPSSIIPAAAILSYSTVSLCIVYFNWWMFTKTFKYVLFVSWFQQVVGLWLYITFALIGRCTSMFSSFHLIKPKMWNLIHSIPLSILFILMVGLANICLQFVQVSTYQVARSLTVLFTIAVGYITIGERQSKLSVFACLFIALGFIVSSLEPATLSYVGLYTGALSSFFQAGYNVTIKSTLARMSDSANTVLFYNLLVSSVLFIPIVVVSGEMSSATETIMQYDAHQRCKIAFCLFASGLLATLMNLSAYFCVKSTSPLTFNVVGVTKSLVQSTGGILLLGDTATYKSMVGLTLSIFGTGWYGYVKVREVQRKSKNVKRMSFRLTPINMREKLNYFYSQCVDFDKSSAIQDDV